MKLNIWGSVWGQTGFDIHTRELSLALIEKLGDKVAVEGGRKPDMASYLKQPEAIRKAVERNHCYETTIGIVLPDWWALKSGDRLPAFYGFGIFEGTQIPFAWRKACNAKIVTELLVPSKHTRDAFKASGVKKPIHIVPHGVNEKIFNYDVKPLKELEDDNFNFLFVGGWRDGVNDRKGLDLALKAYCQEFKLSEKVRFSAKINVAYGQMNYMQMVKDVVPPKDKRPEISILTQQTPTEYMARIYKSSDVFVMPSKAEAFCMPCAEAMACGLPVIAHSFGGQADYIQKGTGFLIPTQRYIRPKFPGGSTNSYIYSETLWGLLSIKILRRRMRYLFDNPGEAKKMGKKASKHILETHKWSDSAKKVIKIISQNK